MAQQRRNSMDEPVYFQDFPSVFDRQKPNMMKIISELEEICEETRQRKEKVPRKAGLAALGAGAAALVLAPITVGFSLGVAGAAVATAATAAATGVVIHDKITDKKMLKQVAELVMMFCDVAKLLRDIEKEKKEMLKKLDKNPEDVFIQVYTLIDQLFPLFTLYIEDSTLERLLEVTQKCTEILEQLELVRSLIRDMDPETQ